SGPILTALVGVYLADEKLDWVFARSAVVALAGLALLAEPRVSTGQVSVFWVLGFTFALLSSLSSAIYRVYFKVLLDRGLSKTALIFLRLIGLTVILGLALVVRSDLFRTDLLVTTAAIGLLGFTIPLFLIISVIQRVEIKSFAMMLFLLPLLTFAFSTSFG